jgi:transcriptional regulator with XRE-family HTH domain
MDMKVDAKRIRAERENRAWSQEHLAQLSGLGLRTVQRIEATGLASNESISALAAVFNLSLQELRDQDVKDNRAKRRSDAFVVEIPRRAAGLAAAICAALLAVFVTRSVIAEPIMLDVGISVNDEERSRSRLLTETGSNAEIELDRIMRLIVMPSVQDGLILLATEVHLYDGSIYRLKAQPRVATKLGTLATIEFGTDSGDLVTIAITPLAELAKR